MSTIDSPRNHVQIQLFDIIPKATRKREDQKILLPRKSEFRKEPPTPSPVPQKTDKSPKTPFPFSPFDANNTPFYSSTSLPSEGQWAASALGNTMRSNPYIDKTPSTQVITSMEEWRGVLRDSGRQHTSAGKKPSSAPSLATTSHISRVNNKKSSMRPSTSSSASKRSITPITTTSTPSDTQQKVTFRKSPNNDFNLRRSSSTSIFSDTISTSHSMLSGNYSTPSHAQTTNTTPAKSPSNLSTVSLNKVQYQVNFGLEEEEPEVISLMKSPLYPSSQPQKFMRTKPVTPEPVVKKYVYQKMSRHKKEDERAGSSLYKPFSNANPYKLTGKEQGWNDNYLKVVEASNKAKDRNFKPKFTTPADNMLGKAFAEWFDGDALVNRIASNNEDPKAKVKLALPKINQYELKRAEYYKKQHQG